jgi:hypothetical protein
MTPVEEAVNASKKADAAVLNQNALSDLEFTQIMTDARLSLEKATAVHKTVMASTQQILQTPV